MSLQEVKLKLNSFIDIDISIAIDIYKDMDIDKAIDMDIYI